MNQKSIILLGGPDSGKTNYLARLWPSFKARKGVLRADRLPDDISYVDSAVEHLMQGSFAPRSDRNLEVGRSDFSIEVRNTTGNGALTELMVPDISGELWTHTVVTSEISQEWLDLLRSAEGAVVFVRALSDQNVMPLDWVTARNILRLDEADGEPSNDPGPGASGALTHAGESDDADQSQDSLTAPDLPTQVLLCELLRYLDLSLADRAEGRCPRVAVVISAYDLIDEKARAEGPWAYLKREFPLFAGRLADAGRLDIKVFGLSIVGGDLADDDDFRGTFFERDITEQGWIITNDGGDLRQDVDVMLPIAWAMGD